MWGRFCNWIRRHFYVVVSFTVGIAFGVSIFALVFFSNRSEIAARALGYGVRATGHTDLNDDLLWFLAGIAVGAGVTCFAWWRDDKALAPGLEEEDVLNRITSDPRLKIAGRRVNPPGTRPGSGR